MASQEKTQNIGLNQWQGNEYIKRQDFVEDNLKIDEAIHSQGQQMQQVNDSLVAHKADTANPHNTTKSQVGLGNVDNVKQMPIAGGTFTGHVSLERKWLVQPQLADYSEMVEVATGVTGSRTINITSSGNVFRHTLGGNTTYTFSNPAPSGQACSLTLIVEQGATARSITFPASVKWDGDKIPDAPAANKVAFYTFVTTNGGARWHGFQSGKEFAI